MVVYLGCYFGSAALAYCAYKTQDKRKFWLFSILSILLTVLLAGLRDYSIGIDTNSYYTKARYWGNAIKAESLGAYMKYYMGIGYGEPLFAFLCGFAAQYFENYSVFLLLVHGIIVTGVYIGAFRLRDVANPAFVLLLFYLVFFSNSLNIMRQYMAMAIVFAALADVPQGKYLRYCVAVGIATMLHTSALLGLGAMLIHWFIYARWERICAFPHKMWVGIKLFLASCDIHIGTPVTESDLEKNRLIKIPLLSRVRSRIRRRQLFIFSALLLLVLLFNPLCHLAISMGVLHEKYLFYLDISKATHTTLITLFLLVEMGAIFLFYKFLRRSNPLFDFFFTNSGTYLILHQISFFLVYGKRVAAYFSLANLVTVAMIPRMYKDKQRRALAYGLILCVVLFYWFYTYILRNASQTYPYRSIFFQ